MSSSQPEHSGPSVAVFAPSLAVTITAESSTGGEAEIHIHAGGQGFWVARMAARLGGVVGLCAPLGGETGTVLKSLLAADGIKPLTVRAAGANGAYIHDRRGGRREQIARTDSPALSRHELDDLYGVTLAAGLESDVTLITGSRNEGVLPPGVYERLARDLRRNGRPVLADLSGDELTAALRGGLDVVKVSDEDLIADGRLANRELASAAEAAQHLEREGARSVVISRSSEAALLLVEGRLLTVDSPHFTPIDHHGAGDSLFAAIGIGVGEGLAPDVAVKLGVAAGALNVARRGLGTGQLREVRSLADQVMLTELSADAGDLGHRDDLRTNVR